MKQQVKHTVGRLFSVIPRSMRRTLIQAILWPELHARPRESVRWLLELHDYIGVMIDQQCIRWGNGVHIKHTLMAGIHSFFYERIPVGARVLDVGCGYGAVAYAIVTHAEAHVVGVDMNPEHIAFARQHFNHPNLHFELGDVTQNLPNQPIDVIVLSSVLEHIEPRVELLQTLINRFNPKLFLIRAPTLERHYFVNLKQELGLFPYADGTHVLEYSPDIFKAEMEQAGLDIRHLEIRWGDIWAECAPRTGSAKQAAKL
jgi:2-polyprenyl-3-methyl-5-hydroxy-6-metoxy-1,4-benzoquinol methylase